MPKVRLFYREKDNGYWFYAAIDGVDHHFPLKMSFGAYADRDELRRAIDEDEAERESASGEGGEVSTGVELIAAERRRQIEVEGWTLEHDRIEHDGSDNIVMAAICYALPDEHRHGEPPIWWPWASSYWKPTPDDRVRELVKAGALIAAEIDRLLTKRGGGRP